jgi:hypothetical protein
VRSDVVLYNCEAVYDATQVEDVLEKERRTLTQAEADRPRVYIRRAVNALRILVHECPSPGISIPCDNKRSTASTMLDTFKTRHRDMKDAEDAADALKAAQGW